MKILLSILLAAMSSVAYANPYAKSDADKFLTTYANITLANYSDAMVYAKYLATSINELATNPTKLTLSNAKSAWLSARESYGQTEIFRLSGGPIDAEEGWVLDSYGAPEGQLNAWPLDENMIDYTIDNRGNKTSGNIIDSTGEFTPVGNDSKMVDITNITPKTLSNLHENGGDANVAAGYHAIEFLLWGQDQDYSNFIRDNITNGALQAGNRPLSDFTTDKFKNRRLDFLKSSAELIVNDLGVMVDAWKKDDKTNYRAALLGGNIDKSKNISSAKALRQIFIGMGVFIKSELANERIAVALLTPSEEDEQSCFSDNTHRDIAMNYQGFKNILFGVYNSQDYGFGAIDKLSNKQTITKLINSADIEVSRMNAIADSSRHFDYQIRPNDPQAKQINKLKNTLRKIGNQMVLVAKSFNIDLTKPDVTDSEETVVN